MSIALALAFVVSLQQAPCQPGQVTAVHRGKDYTITICGVGEVALRGVEPPLGAAVSLGNLDGNPGHQFGGDVLGDKDIGPEALQFLSGLVVGKKVTLVYDGWRVGDFGGRQYAYVYLPDKTFVNAELIRRGLGYADRQGSHPRRDEFLALEASARRAKVGVWASYEG
jgi:endonuclease YncB( thermonuclease family)